jgi:uncharacterized membrane protein YccF (DUF307 family)
LYYLCRRLAEVIPEIEWEIVRSAKIVLNISRELVLNIFLTRLCYLFQTVVLVILIPNLVYTSVWSTATASIAAVSFATEEVELRSAITADFPLARKTCRGRSVKNYII